MTQHAWEDDEYLLADLAAALNEITPLREAVKERGRAAFTWRTIDDELLLAGLIFDSTLDTELEAVQGMRDGDSGSPRVLVFDAEGISVELEVSPDRVAGQILPPTSGQIVIERQDAPEGTITVQADELGFFVVPGAAAGFMRLRCDTPTAKLVTEWVRL